VRGVDDYIQSVVQSDFSTRAFVVGVVYAHRSQLKSFLNDERMCVTPPFEQVGKA